MLINRFLLYKKEFDCKLLLVEGMRIILQFVISCASCYEIMQFYFIQGGWIMYPYLSEFIGTCMLVILGDGVCASNGLEGSLFKGSGPVYVMIGWGLAVALPAMAFGYQSAAHFNPVLTIAMAVIGSFPWSMVPGYILAQMCGGFLGAIIVWLIYKDQFALTEKTFGEDSIGTCRGTFCTGPAIRNLGQNFFGELAATFFLVFLIVCITPTAATVGLNYWFVFAIIMCCGFSLGSTTGFAMNPARDTAPRLAYALLPFKYKDADWKYAWVPILGPLCGAILGGLLGSVVTSWPGLSSFL
jgi:glycerol uptake facilitator protein